MTDKANFYNGPTQLFINNEWVDAAGGDTFGTINPANEQVITQVQEAKKADVDKAVIAARRAFDDPKSEWRTMNKSQRRDLMLKLADLLERDQDEFARVESMDNGKPVHIAKGVDIALSIKCLRYYAGWADKQQGKTIPIDGDYFCYTKHEPVGVCGQIIPWNFPLLMIAWKLGPAFATGCVVVMKSSEKTPLSALMLADLVKEAGFPAGVFNLLSGFGPSCGEHLVKHAGIDKVAFTGSTATGRKVAAFAGLNLKRCTLELGGKSPLIVMPDADIDQAIITAQVGVMLNSGQCCIAGSRVFVHEDIYDKFLSRAKDFAEAKVKLSHEGCTDAGVFDLGPLVDKVQYDKVLGYIEAGKQCGARLVCGGKPIDKTGYYVEPTIFADVKDDMKIAKEEIFGPVMSVLKFSSVEEVVKRANNTSYGLGAGVCTSSMTSALQLSNALRAGTVYVNCYDVFDSAAPFGGFKMSGLGRELGEYGLKNYQEVKCVIMPTA